jgi:hypothetical protein
MDYKTGLLKNTRLTETELLELSRAVMLAAQNDFAATEGKAFHLLEGVVKVHSSGAYIFFPNDYMKKLLDEGQYPEILKIEEHKLLDWISAILEDRTDE